MKRAVFLLFACCMIASSFSACSPYTLTSSPTEELRETRIIHVTAGEVPPSKVLHPLTENELDAIPLAREGMSEEALRGIILDFMKLSLTFRWQPTRSFSVTAGTKTEFKKNTVYGGIPYVSAMGNLYKWLPYYDHDTGLLDVAAIGNDPQHVLGNHCASGVHAALSRVSNRMNWYSTAQMFRRNGCIPIGQYEYDEPATDYRSEQIKTTVYTERNGEQTMYRAYALLKPADAVSYYNVSEGHVLLIEECHVTERDGVIDGNESYVIFDDQTSGTYYAKQEDGTEYQAQNGIRRRIRFSKLFEKGYLPWTIPEFAGEDGIESPAAESSLTGDATPEEILSSEIRCNYPVYTVTLSIIDSCGTELYRKEAPLTGTPILREVYSVKGLFSHIFLDKYADVECRYYLSVRVSTGDVLPVGNGRITTEVK